MSSKENFLLTVDPSLMVELHFLDRMMGQQGEDKLKRAMLKRLPVDGLWPLPTIKILWHI